MRMIMNEACMVSYYLLSLKQAHKKTKRSVFRWATDNYNLTALMPCMNLRISNPSIIFIYLQIIFLSMAVYLSKPGGCLHYNVQSGTCLSGRGLSHHVTLSVILSCSLSTSHQPIASGASVLFWKWSQLQGLEFNPINQLQIPPGRLSTP